MLDAHEAFVVARIEAPKNMTLDEMVGLLSLVKISRSALETWLQGAGHPINHGKIGIFTA